MQAPPLLPDASLRRVAGLARANGWSVAGFAALCGLVSLVQANLSGFTWTLPVIAGGAWELLGRRRLLAGNPAGWRDLIGAQFLVLVVVWAYAWCRWRFFVPDELWQELPAFAQAQLTQQMLAAGLEPEIDRPLLLEMTNTLTCIVLAGVTLVYQCGLAYYYHRQRGRIAAAQVAPDLRTG